MVFSSLTFLFFFLPLFLLLYQVARKEYKNLLILAASIVFYSWGAPKFVFVILGSTFIDFYLVKFLHQSSEDRTRKLLLACSILINLGLLAFFKYANFFVENVNAVLTALGSTQLEWTKVALPIGISFYTFQTLTYSIDVYRGQHKPLSKLTDYLLYIMSFPQMIAGPIVRYTTIANQIVNRSDKLEDKLQGFYRFSIGLAKKVLIANVMGEQADYIMNANVDSLHSGFLWLGMIAYTFQIYFDFSGYSDMAIGLGRMMGFTFPENFKSPYTAKSISEFWRKWHITLGAFMRDYLYIPLGGNRVNSKARLYLNLWIVFLLSGLWHGASWNFVIWGAYHGLFLILDRLFLLKFYDKIGKIPSMLITFLLVMIGWVFFRLESFDHASTYVLRLFDFKSFEVPDVIPAFNKTLFFAVFFAFLTTTSLGRKIESFFFEKEQYRSTEHLFVASATLLLFILSVASITASDFNPFIYFRF